MKNHSVKKYCGPRISLMKGKLLPCNSDYLFISFVSGLGNDSTDFFCSVVMSNGFGGTETKNSFTRSGVSRGRARLTTSSQTIVLILICIKKENVNPRLIGFSSLLLFF